MRGYFKSNTKWRFQRYRPGQWPYIPFSNRNREYDYRPFIWPRSQQHVINPPRLPGRRYLAGHWRKPDYLNLPISFSSIRQHSEALSPQLRWVEFPPPPLWRVLFHNQQGEMPANLPVSPPWLTRPDGYPFSARQVGTQHFPTRVVRRHSRLPARRFLSCRQRRPERQISSAPPARPVESEVSSLTFQTSFHLPKPEQPSSSDFLPLLLEPAEYPTPPAQQVESKPLLEFDNKQGAEFLNVDSLIDPLTVFNWLNGTQESENLMDPSGASTYPTWSDQFDDGSQQFENLMDLSGPSTYPTSWDRFDGFQGWNLPSSFVSPPKGKPEQLSSSFSLPSLQEMDHPGTFTSQTFLDSGGFRGWNSTSPSVSSPEPPLLFQSTPCLQVPTTTYQTAVSLPPFPDMPIIYPILPPPSSMNGMLGSWSPQYSPPQIQPELNLEQELEVRDIRPAVPNVDFVFDWEGLTFTFPPFMPDNPPPLLAVAPMANVQPLNVAAPQPLPEPNQVVPECVAPKEPNALLQNEVMQASRSPFASPSSPPATPSSHH